MWLCIPFQTSTSIIHHHPPPISLGIHINYQIILIFPCMWGYCSIFKPFIWLNLFNFGKLFLPTNFGKLLIILVKPLLNITGPRHRSVLMYVYYICNGKEIKNVISNVMEKKERNREKLIRCKRTCKWRRCEKSLIFNKKILIYILYSA